MATQSKYNSEFQKGIEAMGLSQRGAAHYFGKTEKTIRNWSSGRSRPDHAVMMIIEFNKRHIGFENSFRGISDELHQKKEAQAQKVQNG